MNGTPIILGQYMRLFEQPSKRKTKVWKVMQPDCVLTLGYVKWLTRFRRYVYWPLPQTAYDASCLRYLALFCEQETEARKVARMLERTRVPAP